MRACAGHSSSKTARCKAIHAPFGSKKPIMIIGGGTLGLLNKNAAAQHEQHTISGTRQDRKTQGKQGAQKHSLPEAVGGDEALRVNALAQTGLAGRIHKLALRVQPVTQGIPEPNQRLAELRIRATQNLSKSGGIVNPHSTHAQPLARERMRKPCQGDNKTAPPTLTGDSWNRPAVNRAEVSLREELVASSTCTNPIANSVNRKSFWQQRGTTQQHGLDGTRRRSASWSDLVASRTRSSREREAGGLAASKP